MDEMLFKGFLVTKRSLYLSSVKFMDETKEFIQVIVRGPDS